MYNPLFSARPALKYPCHADTEVHKTRKITALLIGLTALTLIASQAATAQSATSQGTPFQEIWDYITGHQEMHAAEMQALRDEITALSAETQELRGQVAALEARVEELEGGAPPQPQSMTVYMDGTPLEQWSPIEASAGEHEFTIVFGNPTEGSITWTLYDIFSSSPLASGMDTSFTLTLEPGGYRLHVEAELQDGTGYRHDYLLGAG